MTTFTRDARSARRRIAAGLRVWTCVAPLALGACAPSVVRYAARSAAADSAARVAISRERDIQAASIPANTVGVPPLTVRSSDTTYSSMGFGLAALLASDLSRSSRLTVVERGQFDAVLRELEFGQSGRVDSSTAPKVGRLVGAQRLVVGSVDIRPTGALQLGSQVANTTSGGIEASLTGDATVSQLFDAEKALVFRLFTALGVALSPAEQRLVERHPTRSLEAFLAFSKGAQAELARDYAGALTHYTTASRLDPGFAEARARAAILQGASVSSIASLSGLERALLLSAELVNRRGQGVVGSAVDTPVNQQQLVNITITFRTP